MPNDTCNEFVYNICDQQGKLVLSINAHGDVVVNELIARKIRNGELTEHLMALDQAVRQIPDAERRSAVNRTVIQDYSDNILDAIITKGNFTGFSVKTQSDYSDSRIVSVANVDICPQVNTATFCLYTAEHDGKLYQYIAYYDHHHQLCVAQRIKTGSSWSTFTYVKLDSFIGYDGHNYIRMIIDNEGYLHLCANMHTDPLNYWRFTHPYSIEHYVKKPMTGMDEDSVTYPFFIRLHSGQIMFAYRNGVSGNGDHYVNFLQNGQWTDHRMIFNGTNTSKSAYCCGMIGDFNGVFYNSYTGDYDLFFAWRDNHDPMSTGKLCYMRTKDFKQFYNISNESVSLPVQSTNINIIIDAVDYNGGLINSFWRVLQAGSSGTLFCYHKYESNKSVIKAALIKGTSLTTATVVSWTVKLELSELLAGFALSLKEESSAFVVRCGYSSSTIKKYNLNKTTLAKISESSGGDDFYDYPSCVRQVMDNEDGSVSCGIAQEQNQGLTGHHFLAKYEYAKDGQLALPTYLRLIEYTM